jgi:hypothetical protein
MSTATANTAPRFSGSRNLTESAAESVVRIGQLEARAIYATGSAPEAWTVRRAGRWTRTGLDLAAIRRTVPGGGRALAKACARLARAA